MSKHKSEVTDALQDIFLDYSFTSPARSHISKPIQSSVGSRASSDRDSEYSRIRDLWNKATHELQLKSKELQELKALVSVGKSKAYATLEQSTLDMRDKLRFMERQLQSAREQNDRWGSSYDEVAALLRQAEVELAEERATSAAQQQRIKTLEGDLTHVEAEKGSILGRSLAEMRNHDEGLLESRRELERTKSQLAQAEQRLVQMTTMQSEMQETVETLSSGLEESRLEARETRKLLSQALEEVKGFRGSKMSESQLRVQVQHLKLDNARMVRLLASTDEYQSWLRMAEWSHGVTYLPSKPPAYKAGEKKLHSGQAAARLSDFAAVKTMAREYPTNHKDIPVDPKSETQNWVPTDAVKLSVDFKHRHLPHVPMSLISEYLRQLNAIWRRREAAHVEYVQKKSHRTLQELRRQVSQRVPYEEILQHKQIERLKVDLMREKERNKMILNTTFRPRVDEKALSGKWSGGLGDPGQAGLIETSLATVESLSSQVAQLHKENQALRTRVMHAGGHPHSDGSDDALATLAAPAFLDGAQWAGRKALSIGTSLSARCTEIIRTFQDNAIRLDGSSERDLLAGMQNQSALIEGVDRVVSRCVQGLRALLDEASDAVNLPAFNPSSRDDKDVEESADSLTNHTASDPVRPGDMRDAWIPSARPGWE